MVISAPEREHVLWMRRRHLIHWVLTGDRLHRWFHRDSVAGGFPSGDPRELAWELSVVSSAVLEFMRATDYPELDDTTRLRMALGDVPELGKTAADLAKWMRAQTDDDSRWELAPDSPRWTERFVGPA